METPSSLRRLTRLREWKKLENSALVDITNGSPIVGLATGNSKTPSSAAGKSKVCTAATPNSGEAILRRQVKSLLQKVEEEEEMANKPSLDQRGGSFHDLLCHLRSPASFLAPTPANTPQIEYEFPEAASDQRKEEVSDAVGSMINRALLFDSPEESENLQSATDPGEEGKDFSECDLLYNLCEGLRTMTMDHKEQAGFAGKHTRFAYNSDDEIVAEEDVGNVGTVSPGVLLLRGLPAPEGKHLRFHEEGEEEEED